ncbi:MAG: regulatory protein RecX [Lachnotalea sp.]
MLVTALEEYTKGRYKIYLDEQFAFVLYKGELRRFKMKIDSELTESEYEEIINDIILKRAKRRTLYLLKDMDRTEQQVRNKLKEGFYPEDIINYAIEYAKGYHYINDENYARRYVEYKRSTKSRMAIALDLRNKGITKEIIDQVYEESNIIDDEAIVKLIKKKRVDVNEADKDQLRKLYMYLCRKGFRYEDIDNAIARMKEESTV